MRTNARLVAAVCVAALFCYLFIHNPGTSLPRQDLGPCDLTAALTEHA